MSCCLSLHVQAAAFAPCQSAEGSNAPVRGDTAQYEALITLSNTQEDTSKVLALLSEVYTLAAENKDSAYMIRAITGSLYYLNLQGHFDSAIHLAHHGLDLVVGRENRARELQLVAEMASLYYSTGNYQQAIAWGHRSLQLARQEGLSTKAALILNNLGEYHFMLTAYDSAAWYYRQTMQVAAQENHGQLYAYASGGLGMVYSRRQEADSAGYYISLAIDTLSQLEDWYAVGYFLQEQARAASTARQEQRAEEYLLRTLDIAGQQDLRTLTRDVHQQLSAFYQQTDRPAPALHHYQRYISMRDSMATARTREALAEARASYEISLANAETEKAEAKNATLRARSLAAVLGLILFAVLSLVLWLYFRRRRMTERSRHRQRIDALLKTQERQSMEAIITGQEQERRRIAQELHDHLGSLLATVKVNLSTIPVQEGKEQFQTASKLVEQACKDVRSLSHSLHIGITEQFGLQPALEALAASVNDYKALQVRFHFSLPPETLSAAQEILLYRIVQELLSNTLKHAKASRFEVSITGFDTMVNLMAEDNGRGFGQQRTAGMGLQGIEERVRQMQGDFSIDSRPGHGTIINIDLPTEHTTAHD